MQSKKEESSAYKRAGVDIDAQDRALERIRAHVASTRTAGVLGDVGRFGGLFRPEWRRMEEPILVSSADGVGTKLKIAILSGDFTTIGQDLVNHCVDDILVQGASPLYFMDYLSMGKMEPERVEGLVRGMALACRDAGCALLGGEMAEMPGLYAPGDFDLAGFIVGMVDRPKILPRDGIAPGDVVYGLPSNGLHTNGYSLAIKVLLDEARLPLDRPVDGMEATLGEALLAVHTNYLPILEPLLDEPYLKGLAHITGGGLLDNLPRILPPGVTARIRAGTWPVPPIFGQIVRRGGVSVEEAFRVFNLGVGMAAVVDAKGGARFEAAIGSRGGSVHRIGEIVPGDGIIQVEGANATLFAAPRVDTT